MASIKEMLGLVIFLLFIKGGHCWFGGNEKKILLQDVKAITLYSDKSTKGRRSTVQQLECVAGGSAPCSAFRPRVVQCVNTGFDGVDVQWECKSDMDSHVRFGSIEVSCEGFDHPDDPYITAGSCGLRYNLDYTKSGHNSHHDYGYGNTPHQERSYQPYDSYSKKSSSGFTSSIADLIVYCAMGLMIWAFYKTCISSGNNVGDRSDSSTNDDYPTGGTGGGQYGWNTGGGGGNGFGNNFGGSGYPGDASCGGGSRRRGGAGNFWAGAATGGLLGYMFGNRGGNRTGGWGGQNYYGGGNSGWGGGSSGGWGGGGSSFSSGSGGGTRTASGFGGTSRR